MTSNLEHDVAPVENVAAFLVSWGLPDKVEQERMSSGLARLQSAVADLHGIFVKAGSENTDAALASGQRVFHSFQELLQSRRVADLVAAQASVRRQGFWDNRRRELTEALVHQVCHIRPLHLDEASGAV